MGLDAPSTDLTHRIRQRRAQMARDGLLNEERNPHVGHATQRGAVDLAQVDALARADAARERRAERSQTVVEFQYLPGELDGADADVDHEEDDLGFDLTDEETERYEGRDDDEAEFRSRVVDADVPDVVHHVLDLLDRLEPYLAAYEKIEPRLAEIERVLGGHSEGLVLLAKALSAVPVETAAEIAPLLYAPDTETEKGEPVNMNAVEPLPWWKRLARFIYSPA